MADILSSSGYGTIPDTVSKASPGTLITLTTATRRNFIGIHNTSTTSWVFIKAADDPGPYKCILPGRKGVIRRGPPSANNLTGIIYAYATTASEAAAAAALVALEDDGLS